MKQVKEFLKDPPVLPLHTVVGIQVLQQVGWVMGGRIFLKNRKYPDTLMFMVKKITMVRHCYDGMSMYARYRHIFKQEYPLIGYIRCDQYKV